MVNQLLRLVDLSATECSSQVLLLLLLCVVGLLSGRSLHHRVDVIVVHFEVGLGEGLSLCSAWGDVSCVSEHVLGALLVVATGEDTLFILLLTLRDVTLVGPGLIAPLNHLFLLLLPLMDLQE